MANFGCHSRELRFGGGRYDTIVIVIGVGGGQETSGFGRRLGYSRGYRGDGSMELGCPIDRHLWSCRTSNRKLFTFVSLDGLKGKCPKSHVRGRKSKEQISGKILERRVRAVGNFLHQHKQISAFQWHKQGCRVIPLFLASCSSPSPSPVHLCSTPVNSRLSSSLVPTICRYSTHRIPVFSQESRCGPGVALFFPSKLPFRG